MQSIPGNRQARRPYNFKYSAFSSVYLFARFLKLLVNNLIYLFFHEKSITDYINRRYFNSVFFIFPDKRDNT
jgi:hypothetical protein